MDGTVREDHRRDPQVGVSSTLERVDWNAELLRGDLADAVTRLKEQPGNGLLVAGGTLPIALAEMGLIDEYERVEGGTGR